MRTAARHQPALILLLSSLLAIAIGVTGILRPVENWLAGVRAAAVSRPASGQVVIVEMDAASVARLQHWPWPRRHYARVIERLDAAGARTIAFDVDFSARSTAADDRRLAEAIDQARIPVVLPTFRQRAGSADHRQIDSLPLPQLRQNATLAAVAVVPDPDGAVRRMLLGTITAGVPRPSLSAFLGRRSGAAEEQFAIDFSIDPKSIPRLSFIDVVEGRIDPARIARRDVLIGATAIEMGDRYAVPRHGVLPGVVIQALATETLLRGIPVEIGWVPLTVVALGLSAWLIRCRRLPQLHLRFAACVGGMLILTGGLHSGVGLTAEMMPGAVALSVTALARALALVRLERARRQSHDRETGMPNRLALLECEPVDDAGRTMVVASIQGFDRLAAVLGPAGVAALVTRIAERISFASDRATVYRIEERSLAWTMFAAGAEATARLDALTTMMMSPVEIGGRKVDAHLACGIAFGRNPAELVNRASLAASEAAAAKLPWKIASADTEELAWQVSLMGELSDAILDGQIEVFYQPKLDIASGIVSSFEALVRWRHPVRGYMRPDLFVPMAEQSERIMGLTLSVLNSVTEDLRRWKAKGRTLTIAVNISATLVTSRAFLSEVKALLAVSGIPASQLIFEITESATITSPAEAAAALTDLRDMGIALSMDDYGTGQSTLSYLRNLPLSELKIDRSFVQNAHRDAHDAVLVRSTVDLAHELGLKVVAEGVEDEACLAFLRGIGCDMAQGYLIGKPSPEPMTMDLSTRWAA